MFDPGSRKVCSAVAGLAIVLVCGVSVCRADMIYTLKANATCRSSDGKALQPPVTPSLPLAADPASFGMMRATKKINGADCYFFMSEVGLTPPGGLGVVACPDAAVGHENTKLSGTRGIGGATGASNCQ
jgi:hypothetical protein